MNTIQLECFVAVAEHLNFSKASLALKLTQPAVSHQIQTLEEELDVKLFNRTSRNVTLTQEGVLFLPDAQLILKTAMSAKERLGRREHTIPFELGCHNYLELKLLPPVLEQLHAEFEQLRPSIRLVPFPSLLGLVESNQIQAVLGVREESKKISLSFHEICSVPFTCICSPDHPLAQYRALTTAQLEGNFIACSPRQISDSIFRIHSNIMTSLPPENRLFNESIEGALALVKAKMGYTLYPDIQASREPDLCYIPVTNLPKISFGVYCQYRNRQPVLKRFLTLLEQSIRKEHS